ncbi:Uncharacterised protein [Actinobacillus equuli]|nr:Uncharacterised protein [Actinobacillus equuli]
MKKLNITTQSSTVLHGVLFPAELKRKLSLLRLQAFTVTFIPIRFITTLGKR